MFESIERMDRRERWTWAAIAGAGALALAGAALYPPARKRLVGAAGAAGRQLWSMVDQQAVMTQLDRAKDYVVGGITTLRERFGPGAEPQQPPALPATRPPQEITT